MTTVASLFVDTSPQEPVTVVRRLKPSLVSTEEHRAVRYLQTVDPVARVFDAITRRSGVTKAELCRRDQHRRVSLYRNVAAWLMREYGLSFPEIGRELNRDHTTAMSSVRRVDGFRRKVPKIRLLTDELLTDLELLDVAPMPTAGALPAIPDLEVKEGT